MKKVGILTLSPYVYNYGGFLQEMALLDVISHLGGKGEIICYVPTNELNTFSAKRNIKYFTIKKLFGKIHERLCYMSSNKTTEDSTRIRKNTFDVYRQKNLKLSKPLNYSELHTEKLPYDAIICGSDQIWNPDFNIPAFFLGFAKEGQKRIIYGASIGKSHLTARQRKVYKKLMRNLDCISVREKSAQELLAPIAPKPITVVLDPTLLHDRDYWLEKAAVSAKCYQGYVFCYFLDLTKEKVEAAQSYAKKHNLKIVAIPYLHNYYEPLCETLADILDADVNPADFLKLILDAECVITDSFHGSIFSLLFQKKFWVFGRKAGNYDMNTRLDTLLEYFGAERRMISPKDLLKQDDTEFCVSGETLDTMRKLSYQFLRNALSKS